MLNQRLSQKMLQKLSPQQIQLMKLLQVPTANLEQRIKEELEINPALEESISDYDGEKEDLSEPEQIRDLEEFYSRRFYMVIGTTYFPILYHFLCFPF